MKPTILAASLCLAALIAPSSHPAYAQAPRMTDYPTLTGYINALNASTDPQAILIRQEIANGPTDLARELDACARRKISLTNTAPVVPDSQNAYPIYKQWNDLRQKQNIVFPDYADPLAFGPSYTPDQLAAVQTIIDSNPVVFKLVHTAAAMPALVLPPDDFSLFGSMREAAREFRTNAYLLTKKGQYAAAIQEDVLSFNIVRQSNISPSIIQYLTGAAIEGNALNGLQDIMDMAGPNPDVDDQITKTLNQELPVRSIKNAIEAGIPDNVALFVSMKKIKPAAFIALPSQTDGQTPAPTPTGPDATAAESQFLSNFADATEALYLAHQIVLIDAADLPSTQRTPIFTGIDAQDSLAAVDPNKQRDPVAVLINIAAPQYSRLVQRDDSVAAKEQVILAAAAILSIKAKTGSFPATLPGSFTDPFNGKPVGYTLQGQTGFIVYSVGPTGSYDGTTSDNSQAGFRYPALLVPRP